MIASILSNRNLVLAIMFANSSNFALAVDYSPTSEMTREEFETYVEGHITPVRHSFFSMKDGLLSYGIGLKGYSYSSDTDLVTRTHTKYRPEANPVLTQFMGNIGPYAFSLTEIQDNEQWAFGFGFDTAQVKVGPSAALPFKGRVGYTQLLGSSKFCAPQLTIESVSNFGKSDNEPFLGLGYAVSKALFDPGDDSTLEKRKHVWRDFYGIIGLRLGLANGMFINVEGKTGVHEGSVSVRTFLAL